MKHIQNNHKSPKNTYQFMDFKNLQKKQAKSLKNYV